MSTDTIANNIHGKDLKHENPSEKYRENANLPQKRQQKLNKNIESRVIFSIY